jgi:hypothetical protein
MARELDATDVSVPLNVAGVEFTDDSITGLGGRARRWSAPRLILERAVR